MSWLRLLIASGILLGGCVGEEFDLGATEQAAKAQPDGDDGCPPWACGSNSPEIDLGTFHELNLSGTVLISSTTYKAPTPNLEGFAITAFRRWELDGVWKWKSYQAEVKNAFLVAKDNAGNIVHSGSDVVGMAFTVTRGAQTYYLRVAAFSRMYLWAKKPDGAPAVTPTYRFTWSKTPPAAATSGTAVNLCGANTDGDGMPDNLAVIYEADRIQADPIRFGGDPNPEWFNIGCAGHLVAKQHLTGNTKAAAVLLGVAPAPATMRTTNLKMLSADYCGGGDPFTVAGTSLHWLDNTGRMNNLAAGSFEIEARWNETGAICVNTPRIDYNGGSPTFPGGVAPLLAGPLAGGKWCTGIWPAKLPPPPCTTPGLPVGYIISVNQ